MKSINLTTNNTILSVADLTFIQKVAAILAYNKDLWIMGIIFMILIGIPTMPAFFLHHKEDMIMATAMIMLFPIAALAAVMKDRASSYAWYVRRFNHYEYSSGYYNLCSEYHLGSTPLRVKNTLPHYFEVKALRRALKENKGRTPNWKNLIKIASNGDTVFDYLGVQVYSTKYYQDRMWKDYHKGDNTYFAVKDKLLYYDGLTYNILLADEKNGVYYALLSFDKEEQEEGLKLRAHILAHIETEEEMKEWEEGHSIDWYLLQAM